MTHVVHDPIESSTLEGFGAVKRRIALRYGETIAAAETCAGWGRIEVRIVEPPHLAGITWLRDRSGFACALGAQRDPSRFCTHRGELTALAIRLVQRLIIKAVTDHELVKRNVDTVVERCIKTLKRIENIDAQIRELAGSGERAALRRVFESGGLNQREYQAIVREIKDRRSSRRCDLQQARRTALANVAEGLSRSRVPYDHALIHLRDPHILGALDAATRHRIELLSS